MKKTVLFYLIIAICAVSPASSQTPVPIGELKKAMDEFSDNMALSLPFNSTMGLNWSDAYIKNFPHFGVGASIGYTTMNAGSLGDLLKQFDLNMPSVLYKFGGFPVPGYTLEGRLGGLGTSFDMGFKFGYLPMKPSGLDKLDYLLIGGDVRFAVLKQNLILPNISVGMGYNYQSGGIGKTAGSDRIFEYFNDGAGNSETLTLKAPEIDVDWSTSVLDFKAQISKSFLIITPYFGIGACGGWSKAGYSVTTTVTDSAGNLDAAKLALKQFGIDDLSSTGFSSTANFNGWSYRAYGGLSLNFTVFRLDITALYNFRNSNYGVTMGARVQL
ncbi:MAG: hypothetical protein FWH38_08435 [Treponema sp.]|nr:hypothetical protein [Treponema sp.]